MKNKKGNKIEIITSWDDFRKEDERLIELLIKYEIPAIFYIPYKEILKPEKLELAKLASQYFEIGGHTVNHYILTAIEPAEMYSELTDGKSLLEEALGVEVTSFCYPRGRYNEKVIDMLKKVGYTNARTVDVGNVDFPTDPFRTKTSAHVFQRREYGGMSWTDYALEKLDYVMDFGGYFHLWGHAYEVEKNHEWDNLEKFLAYMKGRIDENTLS